MFVAPKVEEMNQFSDIAGMEQLPEEPIQNIEENAEGGSLQYLGGDGEEQAPPDIEQKAEAAFSIEEEADLVLNEEEDAPNGEIIDGEEQQQEEEEIEEEESPEPKNVEKTQDSIELEKI